MRNYLSTSHYESRKKIVFPLPRSAILILLRQDCGTFLNYYLVHFLIIIYNCGHRSERRGKEVLHQQRGNEEYSRTSKGNAGWFPV